MAEEQADVFSLHSKHRLAVVNCLAFSSLQNYRIRCFLLAAVFLNGTQLVVLDGKRIYFYRKI